MTTLMHVAWVALAALTLHAPSKVTQPDFEDVTQLNITPDQPLSGEQVMTLLADDYTEYNSDNCYYSPQYCYEQSFSKNFYFAQEGTQYAIAIIANRSTKGGSPWLDMATFEWTGSTWTLLINSTQTIDGFNGQLPVGMKMVKVGMNRPGVILSAFDFADNNQYKVDIIAGMTSDMGWRTLGRFQTLFDRSANLDNDEDITCQCQRYTFPNITTQAFSDVVLERYDCSDNGGGLLECGGTLLQTFTLQGQKWGYKDYHDDKYKIF